MDIRSGSVGFQASRAGITVPLSPPATGAYTVVVQATNTAGYCPLTSTLTLL